MSEYGETQVLSKDFADGTISPMSLFTSGGNNDGSYAVIPANQDPLGQNIASCKLKAPSGIGGGRSCLSYDSPENYLKSRVVIEWMAPILESATWVGGLALRNGLGATLAEIQIYNNQWYLAYYNNGGMSSRIYFGSVSAMTKYVLDLRVKIGNGDGVVEVYVDGVLMRKIENLNNLSAGSMNHIEVGTLWGNNGVECYVYSIVWNGEVVTFITVTGTVVDINGLPIPDVGIRLGGEPPQSQPWNVGTYLGNVYTNTNGVFSIQTLPGSYGELKLIKMGYGDPNYKVSSVKKIRNIQIPDTPTYNFGVITLENRPAIQAQALPEEDYWAMRAVTIWNFQYSYTSAGYENLLEELKSKDLRFNYIDLRWGPGNPSMNTTEARSAIQVAHRKGFKVMLTLLFQEKATDVATLKSLALSRLEAVADLKPDAIVLSWETLVPDNGTHNALWQEILDAVRARADWNPLIGSNYTTHTTWSLDEVKSNTWFKNLDFLVLLQWIRLSPAVEGQTDFFDPTELELLMGYQVGHAWWEGTAVNLPQFYTDIRNWLGKRLLINIGGKRMDGNTWRPFGTMNSVKDEEELAMFYKAFFSAMSTATINGCVLEHFSFATPAPPETGCFRDTLPESFINEGLKAHSIGDEEPIEPPPIPLWKVGAALTAIFTTIGVGIEFAGKGGQRR